MKKRIFAVFIAAAFLFLTACRGTVRENSSAPEATESESGTVSQSITLLYSAADTFNPYTAATDINRRLCRLLYEPLVKLDDKYNTVYSLAEAVALNGTECTVQLKKAYFSDGSPLTAEDVLYSFRLAKDGTSEYSHRLYEAASAAVRDSQTLVITLTRADPYFEKTLDFPIIKKGSDKLTNSDGVLAAPTGCGRYKLNEKGDGLVTNEYSVGSGRQISEIRLINAPDAEAVSHYVEIGAADMYYSDISDGSILRMSGKKVSVNLNRLVYIGVNLSDDRLAVNEVRQAISSGLDRTELCSDGYYNNAVAASGFYNPAWDEVRAVQNINLRANSEITVENLEQIGYNKTDGTGIRMNAAGRKLKFTLLVNSENRMRASAARLIAKRLSEYGISVTVVEKSFADYKAALEAGSFELYLAEVELTPNMDLSCLVTEGASAAYGIKQAPAAANTETEENGGTEGVKSTSAEIVSGVYSGANTIADAAAVLQTELPVIPVCYRTGVLFYNDKIENVNNSSECDIYFSIDSYTIK